MTPTVMVGAVALWLGAAPTPSPSPTGVDDDAVTPGWLGFTAMFLVGVAVLLLVVDMVRRIRRVRYRAEVNEQLDAEEAAAREQDGGA